MKFDPNYTYDSDSDQEDGKSSDSDGDGDDYSDYSDEGEDTDDDDSSWKVRSSAVRALTAVIDSRNISLSLLWETSAVDHLLSRFKEREEGVRVGGHQRGGEELSALDARVADAELLVELGP